MLLLSALQDLHRMGCLVIWVLLTKMTLMTAQKCREIEKEYLQKQWDCDRKRIKKDVDQDRDNNNNNKKNNNNDNR